MKEAYNLLAVCFALLVASGLGWLAWEMNQPEEVVEAPPPPPPKIPGYHLGWSRLERWVKQPPTVVASQAVPRDLQDAYARQNKLLVIVTGLANEAVNDKQFETQLTSLQEAFPDAEVRSSPNYHAITSSHGMVTDYSAQIKSNPSSYNYRYYYTYRSSNEQMIGDFNHTVRNARLGEIDYVVSNLNFKMQSWERELARLKAGNVSDAQYQADKAFLDNMPGYIEEWRALKRQWQEFQEEHPDPQQARLQWTDFEQNDLPVINTHIEGQTTDTWKPDSQGYFEANISRRAVLYTRVEIAGRVLYLLTSAAQRRSTPWPYPGAGV